MKSKIDFKNNRIYGRSGDVYRIAPDEISSFRWAEFEIRSVLLATGFNLQQIFDLVQGAKNDLINGKNNPVGNAINATEKLDKIITPIAKMQDNNYNAVIEFCSLFCVKEGEDVGSWSTSLVEEKYNDWREIPAEGFFFVVAASNTHVQKLVSKRKQRNGKINGLTQKESEVRDTYEKMRILVSKKTNYDVGYLRSMYAFDFFDLYELTIKLNKQ